jgi:hypothetical protein
LLDLDDQPDWLYLKRLAHVGWKGKRP